MFVNWKLHGMRARDPMQRAIWPRLSPVLRLLHGATPEFRAKKIWRLQIRVTGHQSWPSGALRTCKSEAEMQAMTVRGDNVSQVFDACAARSGER